MGSGQGYTAAAASEFLALEDVSLRWGDSIVFKKTNWVWPHGQRWAMLGPDGSGKSVLLDALFGSAVVVAGEVRGPRSRGTPVSHSEAGTSRRSALSRSDRSDSSPSHRAESDPVVARVSPIVQRELAARESSFYQLRWHNSLEQGPRTVAEFLAQKNVEEHNPFEVGVRLRNKAAFAALRGRFLRDVGIQHLWRRRLIHLSNGEMRKTLLVHALLKSPDLLILEDAYAGLDVQTCKKLARVISGLMRRGWAILFATHRPDEIPSAATHVLMVDNFRILAGGPKAEIIRLWRKRFGNGRSQPAGTFEGDRTERLRQKRGQSCSPRVLENSKADNNSRAAHGERPLVELTRVSVAGAGRAILKNVTWTLREGECWALLGPNGAGKTTLLNLIQGDHPQVYAQDIRLFGRQSDSTQAVWDAREQMGWVSPELHQHYPASWTAEAVVCSGFFNSIGLHQACSRRERAAARRWLADVGLGKCSRVAFGDLAFGNQRLVLLARAVVKKPRLLVLDEPCQGLDAEQRLVLLGAIDRVVAQSGTSLIFVTHHKEEMPRCIDHVLLLRSGKVQAERYAA